MQSEVQQNEQRGIMASQPRPERRSGRLYQKLATRGPRVSARKGVYMLEGPCWVRFRIRGKPPCESLGALRGDGRGTNYNKESEQQMRGAGVWSADVCSVRRLQRALRPEPLPWSRAETAMTVSENLRRVCECDRSVNGAH